MASQRTTADPAAKEERMEASVLLTMGRVGVMVVVGGFVADTGGLAWALVRASNEARTADKGRVVGKLSGPRSPVTVPSPVPAPGVGTTGAGARLKTERHSRTKI